MKKVLLLSLFLVSTVFLAACVPAIESATGNAEVTTTPGENTQFAQCLTDKGVKMYGADWCPHCNNQKDMFGDDWAYVDYVECETNRAACQTAGITGYPTWVIDGQHYPGEATFEKLSRLSGCQLA